jgi:hypothetical protein
VTRKQLVHIILLVITIPIGELYQLFHTQELRLRHWFLLSDRVQDIEWYIKDSSDKLAIIVVLAVWLANERKPLLKKTVTAFLFYRIVDLLLYFIDFDSTTAIYAALYISIGGYIVFHSLKSYRQIKCKRK